MSNIARIQPNCHTWRSEEFWNNNHAESLVITSLNMVPGAPLTLGSVPGFPSTAQNRTTESTLFIVCVKPVQLEGSAAGRPRDSAGRGARRRCRAAYKCLFVCGVFLIRLISLRVLNPCPRDQFYLFQYAPPLLFLFVIVIAPHLSLLCLIN